MADAKVTMQLELETNQAERTFRDFIDTETKYTSKSVDEGIVNNINTQMGSIRNELKT